MKNPLRRFPRHGLLGTGLSAYVLVALVLALVSIVAIVARSGVLKNDGPPAPIRGAAASKAGQPQQQESFRAGAPVPPRH
jgi:hypothetical protein